jgi:HNH endonuclease
MLVENYQLLPYRLKFKTTAMANAYWDAPIPMDVDCDQEPATIAKPLVPKQQSYRKRTIPKTLKINVWNHYIGKEIGSSKCMCCQQSEIIQGHFEAGHVISERDGGTRTIANLRPICSLCNKSMGAQNMLEFMKGCGYRKPHNWNGGNGGMGEWHSPSFLK